MKRLIILVTMCWAVSAQAQTADPHTQTLIRLYKAAQPDEAANIGMLLRDRATLDSIQVIRDAAQGRNDNYLLQLIDQKETELKNPPATPKVPEPPKPKKKRNPYPKRGEAQKLTKPASETDRSLFRQRGHRDTTIEVHNADGSKTIYHDKVDTRRTGPGWIGRTVSSVLKPVGDVIGALGPDTSITVNGGFVPQPAGRIAYPIYWGGPGIVTGQARIRGHYQYHHGHSHSGGHKTVHTARIEPNRHVVGVGRQLNTHTQALQNQPGFQAPGRHRNGTGLYRGGQ